jgi:hypothetical protein
MIVTTSTTTIILMFVEWTGRTGRAAVHGRRRGDDGGGFGEWGRVTPGPREQWVR